MEGMTMRKSLSVNRTSWALSRFLLLYNDRRLLRQLGFMNREEVDGFLKETDHYGLLYERRDGDWVFLESVG
jgi:hypothetical protein